MIVTCQTGDTVGTEGTLGLGRGGGGGDLVPTMPRCVCPKVKEMVNFSAQGSKMNQNISLEMGMKFAASFNMSENLC